MLLTTIILGAAGALALPATGIEAVPRSTPTSLTVSTFKDQNSCLNSDFDAAAGRNPNAANIPAASNPKMFCYNVAPGAGYDWLQLNWSAVEDWLSHIKAPEDRRVSTAKSTIYPKKDCEAGTGPFTSIPGPDGPTAGNGGALASNSHACQLLVTPDGAEMWNSEEGGSVGIYWKAN